MYKYEVPGTLPTYLPYVGIRTVRSLRTLKVLVLGIVTTTQSAHQVSFVFTEMPKLPEQSFLDAPEEQTTQVERTSVCTPLVGYY